MAETLLEVRDLQKYFPLTSGFLVSRVRDWAKAVDGTSFRIARGERRSVW
jgi:oligopeptide transport system ATP-binding protein